jgi:mono/diheme cytochrome c family protein
MNTSKWLVSAVAMAIAFTAFSQTEFSKAGVEMTGAEMYRTYCASCHGLDGKGLGPVAAALKRPIPDLTTIAKRNRGEFPAFRITHIIDGFEVQDAHGTRDMPVWGDYFRTAKRDEPIIELREHNLTEYIRSIQK